MAGTARIAAVPTPLTRPQVIDRMGELKTQMERIQAEVRPTLDEVKARLKPLTDEYQKLEEQAETWFDDRAADQSHTEDGNAFLLSASERELERTVTDPLKLYKISRLSIGKFLSTFTKLLLGAIDKQIPQDKHHLFLKAEKSGRRTLKVVAKSAPPPKAA